MRRLLVAAVLLAATPAAAAERIVAVGGAVTEIVYALGMGDRLVAVDSTSTWPAEADALPDVGYMRQLSAEPIVAMAPDLVLALDSSGPAATLDQLRAAGIPLALVPDRPTAEGTLDRIRSVGAILGREAEAGALAGRVDAELKAAMAAGPADGTKPSVLFVMNAGRGAPMGAGEGTAAEGIIALAGGRNAITGYRGYKPLAPEAVVAAAPDVILAMRETVDAAGGAKALLDLPELRQTPAARAGRLVAMDGLLLLGFGPRTPQAVRTLATELQAAASAAD